MAVKHLDRAAQEHPKTLHKSCRWEYFSVPETQSKPYAVRLDALKHGLLHRERRTAINVHLLVHRFAQPGPGSSRYQSESFPRCRVGQKGGGYFPAVATRQPRHREAARVGSSEPHVDRRQITRDVECQSNTPTTKMHHSDQADRQDRWADHR